MVVRWMQNGRWFGAVVLTLAMVVIASAQHGFADVRMPAHGIAAHRGASASHPENTLPAIREAVALGAAQIEIDIRRTADGKIVLMHDGNLSRTTDVMDLFPTRAEDDISRFSFEEIRRLDAGKWKSARFAGERIPTLREAMELIPRDIWINLDVKGDAECVRLLVREVVEADRLHQSIFSVRGEQMVAARQIAKAQSLSLIINNMNRKAIADYVNDTLASRDAFIQFIGKEVPTDEHIKMLKSAGVKLNYCCSDNPNQIKEWLDRGIDFPLVNDVAVGVGVFEKAR